MTQNNIIVVGLSGATNSGKTSLSRVLKRRFPTCHIISQDDYFYDVDHPGLIWMREVKHPNYEDLSSLNMEKLVADVKKWINIQKLNSAKREMNGLSPKKILVVEGFRILSYKPLVELLDKKYFLTITEDVCKQRRRLRVYDPPDVPGYMEKVVWPEYLKHLEELEHEDDIEFFDGTEDQVDVQEKIMRNFENFCGLSS